MFSQTFPLNKYCNFGKQYAKANEQIAMLAITEPLFSIFAFLAKASAFVEFANELSKIDTTGVEITNSILGEYNIFRKDEIKESFDRDLLLDNAPEQGDGMFKIPKVIG